MGRSNNSTKTTVGNGIPTGELFSEEHESLGLPKFLKPLTFITENQRKWYDILTDEDNKIMMCHAVAGVGKTHITLYSALEHIFLKNKPQKKLIIINPTVDVGDESKLGFLPGSLDAKIMNYNESAYYVLCKLMPKNKVDELIAKEKIQFRVLNFLRGVNLEDMVVVLDEAQNASPRQLKTLMTRINDNTKLIIQGDLGQCDKYRDYKNSGFFDVWGKLWGLRGVDYMEFTPNDVIRSQIVKDVLARYETEDTIELNGFH
jgi:phosphate starvation-inducible protein PhoH and related proteins